MTYEADAPGPELDFSEDNYFDTSCTKCGKTHKGSPCDIFDTPRPESVEEMVVRESEQILSLLNPGLPYKKMHPQKGKLQDRLRRFLTTHASHEYTRVREIVEGKKKEMRGEINISDHYKLGYNQACKDIIEALSTNTENKV